MGLNFSPGEVHIGTPTGAGSRLAVGSLELHGAY
jgi:hypothetical protein